MSEQKNKSAEQRAQMMLDAYNKGVEQRNNKSNLNSNDYEHEAHVQKYWKDSIIAYLKHSVIRSKERMNYRTWRVTYGLPLDDETRNAVVCFLASYFDLSLKDILSNIKLCGDNAISQVKRSYSKSYNNRNTYLLVLGLGVITLILVLLKDIVKSYLMLMPILWIIIALFGLGGVILTARSSKLNRTIRQTTNPIDTLEKCCDICAATRLQNANRTLLAICLALMVGAGGYLIYLSLSL